MRVCSFSALATALILVVPTGALAGWTKGTFQSGGKPVEECHCTPASTGIHPAVILLHGLSLPGGGNETFEKICTDLAAQGYFAEFIEFYSQTGEGTRVPTTGITQSGSPKSAPASTPSTVIRVSIPGASR